MEILFLGWVVFSVVGWLLGNMKGRGGLGFLLGAFLGPIGWVVILALADNRRKCPLCAGALPDGKVVRCKNCGGDLSPGAAAVRPLVDPLEEWERKQAGVPPVPEHLKGARLED